MDCTNSLQTNPKFDQKFDWSKFNQTAQEEHRVVTEAKSGTEHKPKSPQVAWCESSITINGKTHPLPTPRHTFYRNTLMYLKELEPYQVAHTT